MSRLEITVLLPAKNEEIAIGSTVERILSLYPGAEVIVVDDGSTDNTGSIAEESGALVIRHPYSKGNGSAIKTGLRAATKDLVVCMDADGQHRPEDIGALLNKMSEGYDMVVGARDHEGQAGLHRCLANGFYNRFASWMVGHKIGDLTSGFRAVRRRKFLEFISLLPNKFSYPTTITMSFFRAGYSVAYVPITVLQRAEGSKSHINLWKDGLRFLLIIFKVGTLFSPLKLFIPISFSYLILGIGYYVYTFSVDHRLSSISVFLWSTSVTVFLIGLVSEQITQLLYKDR
ncbi:glycosyltransferase family 2 protein [Marinobacter nauticus]|uniref:glycosyltransferase family 2 protein n=1 Tax=Marinobacter nauticus TaxID=2743 RepID=UPI001D190117|nr:glycosyltransferase family 2 protein [Marinobacter nauticus]MCC4270427.1 glycosyltransferase family 2 protein [Marinobacter nauticus]